MEVIRISRKLILAEVLKALSCHGGQYTVWPVSSGKQVASVSFVCSANITSDLGGHKFCYGKPASTVEEAQENAAEEGIKYLQRTFGVDVDDINYWEKIVLSCHNHDYAVEVRSNEKKIRDLVAAAARLKDGWELAIREIAIVRGTWEAMEERGMDNVVEDSEATGVSHRLQSEMVDNLSDVMSRIKMLLDDVNQQNMESNVYV